MRKENENLKRQLDVKKQDIESFQDKIEARNREADELIYKLENSVKTISKKNQEILSLHSSLEQTKGDF